MGLQKGGGGKSRFTPTKMGADEVVVMLNGGGGGAQKVLRQFYHKCGKTSSTLKMGGTKGFTLSQVLRGQSSKRVDPLPSYY